MDPEPYDYGSDIEVLDERPEVVSRASTEYGGDESIIENFADIDNLDEEFWGNRSSAQNRVQDETPAAVQAKPSISGSLKRPAQPVQIPEVERPSKNPKTSHASDLGDAKFEPHHNAHIIVHCSKLAAMMQRLKLSRGVQFELARLISINELDQSTITEKELKQLQGSNEEAVPKIAHVFLLKSKSSHLNSNDAAFANEHAATSPWKELDVEDAALSDGPYEGLGNNPSRPNWYGGKIQFRGRLQVQKDGAKDGEKKPPQLVLEPLALGSSCRFTRRFGSWSFIRIKIPDKVYYDKGYNLTTYFSRPFIIWGTVFRACYAKEDNVFLYMTNEIYQSFHTVEGRLSLEGFMTWHNPMSENKKQLMTKWSSRTVLGFSNSFPGPRLEDGSILPEPDIVSADNSDMTDGCGLSTRKIHHEILLQLGLPVIPSAFQFRVAGCKGMSLLSENPEFVDDRKILVRPSQTKIRYPKGVPLDPAMLTIDLLRTPHMRSGISLSNDMVINLAENGVPAKVFIDLFKLSLDELVKSLTTWEGPDAMFNLWCAVEKLGGVLSARRAREANGEARVRGYSNLSPEERDEGENDDEDDISNGPGGTSKSAAWWSDEISGCPSPLEDTVMVLLDSGFRPQECPVLRDKLKNFTTSKIENRIRTLRFDIAQSCIAFAVPDPYGVLGEDEIQIKSSSRNLKLEDGTLTDVITGDVLIGRNPTKNPCDIRKVKAVEHPLLRNYVDVIVCSIKGLRRLIDFCGGGDYDGDTLVVIWLACIILNFRNADERHSKEGPGLKSCFERDNETVGDFVQRTESWTSEKRTEAMQVYLLGGLCDPSLVGKYAGMHEYATYRYGYSHWRTTNLNFKFCLILDSSKNGLRIKKETLSADSKQYSKSLPPQWKMVSKKKKDENKLASAGNEIYPMRDPNLPPFIMDILVSAAQKEKTRVMAEMDKVFAELTDRRPDPHLIQPWLDAQEWARRSNGDQVQKELDMITAHVQQSYERHVKVVREGQGKKGSFTNKPIVKRQDALRNNSRDFQAGPSRDLLPSFMDDASISRIRASYAYKYDSERGYKKWSQFPWNVDMRQLCAIKAAALGPYKVVTSNFYERFKLVKRN